MKPIDVKSNSYAEYNEDSNEKDPKIKAGDRARISKYKNIFANWYTQNWAEKVFIITKIKNTVPWTYVIGDLNGEPITGIFMKKNCKNQIKKKIRIEKIIEKKGGKLYVKWKGYNNSFNCWINKKGLV